MKKGNPKQNTEGKEGKKPAMIRLAEEGTEIIRLRNLFLGKEEDLRDRYGKMESYLRRAEQNHLLNYSDLLVKKKLADEQVEKVFKAMDAFADAFEKSSNLCGDFLKIANGKKKDKKELLKAIMEDIFKCNEVIFQMKPDLEELFGKLHSLVADAEKELRENKYRVLRR